MIQMRPNRQKLRVKMGRDRIYRQSPVPNQKPRTRAAKANQMKHRWTFRPTGVRFFNAPQHYPEVPATSSRAKTVFEKHDIK